MIHASDDPATSAGDLHTLVAVFSPEGRLLEANQFAFDAVGMTPATALGKHYSELPPLAHRPEVATQFGALLERAVRGDVAR